MHEGNFLPCRGRQRRPRGNRWEMGEAQLHLMQAEVAQGTVDDSGWTEPRVLHSGLVNNIFRIKGCGKKVPKIDDKYMVMADEN